MQLQRFVNTYVQNGASRSLLSKIVLYLRAIFEHAVERGIISRNPGRKLKAKARPSPSFAVGGVGGT